MTDSQKARAWDSLKSTLVQMQTTSDKTITKDIKSGVRELICVMAYVEDQILSEGEKE